MESQAPSQASALHIPKVDTGSLAVADESLVESGDERLASTQALRHSVLKCYVSVLAGRSVLT